MASTSSIFWMYAWSNSAMHHIFFPPRLQVVALQQNPDCLSAYVGYQLALYFFEKGRHSLAIRIADAIYKAEPHNLQSLTNLASLYRQAGDSQHADRLFRDLSPHMTVDRGFYMEWGTSAASEAFRLHTGIEDVA